MDIIFLLCTMVVGIYCTYLGVVLLKIPQTNWDEFRKFKGNGRGMVITSDGRLETIKYKTDDDYARFINGIRVIDMHDNDD